MKRLLLSILLFSGFAAAQPSRDAAWRRDLDQLATELPKLHPNLFYYSPRSVFDREVARLRDDIPSLRDTDVMIRMAAIVALTHDGHTTLNLNQRPVWFRSLPLEFRWFDDGLFCIGASDGYARAAGAEVLRIGGRSVEEAYDAVKMIVSHDVETWVRNMSPVYLANADVLRALGIAPSAETVAFEFQDRAGRIFTLDVASLDPGQTPTIVPYPDPAAGFEPLWRRDLSRNYWFTYIESSRTLYFAYNSCQEMPDLPFARFNDQLWAAFDAQPVERLVVDLRNNGGGSSNVIYPFLQAALARANRLSSIRVSIITGRGTFSSGLLNAIDLHQGPVVSYGEPTGQSPNHYGQVSTLVLIQTGTFIRYSTRQFSFPQLPPGPLAPDVAVPFYSSDYFARHDPYLAAVLAGARPAPSAGTLAVVNAATFRGAVAPGSIATLFGEWDAGADLSVDAVPARIFAAVRGQINFLVPPETRPGLAAIRISRNGAAVADGSARILESAPGIFAVVTGDGAIVLYATGQGSGDALPRVYVGKDVVEVEYAGPHAGLPGLWQINARAPEGVPRGEVPVFVTVGGAASNAVTFQLGN